MLTLRRPIAVTMGDPAGIGIEITLQAWLRRDEAKLPPFKFYADPECARARAKAIGLDVPFQVSDDTGFDGNFAEALPIVPIRLSRTVVAGTADPAHAPAIIAAIAFGISPVYRTPPSAIIGTPVPRKPWAAL